MMHTTTHYRTAKRERLLKPVFGAAAVFAALATLGLTVAGPAALSRADPSVSQVLASRSEARPTEVAILPGTIEVVATRTKVASRSHPNGYLPATYKVR